MDATDAGEPPDLSPAEAFTLVGNEHRVAILEALLSLHRTGEEYPVSFSTLREAAAIDVSSQFSYHLDKLVGHFVEQREEGYAFRYAGWNVATAILAGTYNRRDRLAAAPADGTCPLCDAAALAATYRDEWLGIDCSACSSSLTRYPFPPGGLAERTTEEFLRVFDRHVRTDVRLARDGICPACTGSMRAATGPETDGVVGYRCERCGNRLHPTPGLVLLETPVVRRFYGDRDVDVEARPFWEFRPCVDERLSEVTGDSPWRCEVRMPLDDRLVVTLDEDLRVASTTVERG